MREMLARLLDWFRRDALDKELAEELRFHKQQLERDALSRGATPREAPHAASRQLGNATAIRELARDRWSWPNTDRMLQDIRYAIRALLRSPAYTLTVVVTLSLGIGANLGLFGVVQQLMYRPLPYLRDPTSVNRVYLQNISRGKRVTRGSDEYTRYLDLRRWTSSFADFAVFSDRALAVGRGGELQEQRVATVSASFFNFFSMRPALGRFFTIDEDVIPRGADVAVISYAFWQTQFGGRDVIGEPLQVGNIAARIIGVAPQGFSGADESNPAAVFVPITTFAGSVGNNDAKSYYLKYQWGWTHTLVRRKPGVTEAQASADLTQAFIKSWEAQLATEPDIPSLAAAQPLAVASAVKPWGGPDPSLEARTARWMIGIAGIVLIIACANVTNLSLARALRRQRETAVRLALGAARSRIVMQSFIESVILSGIATLVSLLVAQWSAFLIRGILVNGSSIGASADLVVNWRVLWLASALALGVAVVTGIVPALLSQRYDLAPTLRAGSRGGGSHRTTFRSSLLVVQGGLTVVLLVGAALFVRSLTAVRNMRMGYSSEQVLRVNRNERGVVSNSDRTAMRRTLLAAAQALPEVRAASWVSSTPFISTSSTKLYVTGIDSVPALGEFTYQATTPDYFKVMDTHILRGRGITDQDRAEAPRVAIVSQSMARILWPDKEAIGQCMRVMDDTMPCTTVVGIAEDMVQRDITGTQRYHFYLPIEQFPRTNGNGLLLLLRGDPAVQGEAIRKSLQKAIVGDSYVTVTPLSDIVADAQRSWRLGATLFASFGVLALLVAAVGLYGVVSYNVAQRMHELGVRIALGATPRGILRLVVGQSVRFVIVGVVTGIAIALAASYWVQPLLFRQSATDPTVYVLVAGVMLVVAVLASASPAMLASRADPNRALRVE